ncbi:protein lethal(2) giant larvae-like [Ctenocephalides felis]|uniref:protein lethal(2) giant larvae-like n=1 Tax=Ctenocephalides felis TaxID=7515 RepID=UPI000E6E157B|nr:protein lethal(2) giant larvae-like [Ctenocephalides felis]
MLKFIRGKGQQPSAERLKLQRELFAFRKTVQHGFPNKPSALAWDPELRLMALGTMSGAVKVFGRPGVEFYGQHSNPDCLVLRIVFIPGAGRLVSLCADNSLHLWEINESSLVEVRTLFLEGKLKRISAMCVESTGAKLLLGTEGGNIYPLDLVTFTTTDDIIYQDVVMQHVPETYKLTPGAVEAISERPGHPDQLLIGYSRGLAVLWNKTKSAAAGSFVSSQQLEDVSWNSDGKKFTSAHNDGSYCEWDVVDVTIKAPVTPYGPYPCKTIPRIIRGMRNDNALIVFSGGMPRASHGEKHTVSVVDFGKGEDKPVAFDFTSKVIDFFLVDASGHTPQALIVLCEEELVAIELNSDNWCQLPPPYLVSLHAAAVTFSQHVSNVPQWLWDDIINAGKSQMEKVYSDMQWPISGGVINPPADGDGAPRELLLTGHEDGSVRFWDASGVALSPMYKFSTAGIFSTLVDDLDDGPPPDDGEEEWPVLKRAGVFDPYSDDPRLAIKKVCLCPMSGILAVAGTAGHVVMAKINGEATELKVTTMNIVSDRDGFVWKGYDELTVKSTTPPTAPGFQISGVLQLHPPAAVTCLALQADWGLVSVGTAHGMALYDYCRHKPVTVKCTLNPLDLSGAGDTPISRRKSFKKSLRESFRRLRKGRSTRRAGNKRDETQPAAPANTGPQTPAETRPVERQIEARPVDDSLGSMVRCLYFARTFIANLQTSSATLWAGTNNGTVYVFTINVPSGQKREQDDVTCQLAKEIQLKHRAPVIAIAVLDGASQPLPEPLEVEKGVAPIPDSTQPHRVLIASEEQFKIFSLPNLKPFCKYKLTAHEGARVRRTGFATFSCNLESGEYHETGLLCLTNLGDLLVLSVPELRRQLNAAAIRREDINGISSLTFTRAGEALYLHSSSELQRITVSATKVTSACCHLNLSPSARPELQPAQTELDNADSAADDNEECEETQGDSSIEILSNDASKATQKIIVTSVQTVKEHTTNLTSSTSNTTQQVKENGERLVNGVLDSPNKTETSGSQDLDVTITSSVGDITIDSVKDHLNSTFMNMTTLSGGGDDVSGRLTFSNMPQAVVCSVIVKTTTTTINNSSGNSLTTTEVVNSTNSGITSTLETVETRVTGAPSTRIVETSLFTSRANPRAPLACVEEMESEGIATNET